MNRNTSSTKSLARYVGLLGLLSLFVVGCGSDSTIVTPPPPAGIDPGTGAPPVELADISLIASSNVLPSDGTGAVTLSAVVRDTNNNVVEGRSVIFSADSGLLRILEGVTNSDGVARAELTIATDPTNRAIQVTARTGDLSDTVTVNVQGTELTLEGPTNLVRDDTVSYTAKLLDSGGRGLAGRQVDIVSAAGNVLSASMLQTNSQGEARFELTATQAGEDTLSVSALGLVANLPVVVSADDNLTFITPQAGAEIELDTVQAVTVEWLIGGAPQQGVVSFSSTRGTLSAQQATLDASGRATVDISASTAGPATLTATVGDSGTQTQRTIEFVAITPAKISVQASRFTVGPGEQSTIVATIRDANDNPVKNKLILFQVEDVSGGSLSTGSAITGSAGTAQTVYTAGQTVSASGGVIVTATVQENPAVSGQVALTVARKQVDISIGTGNELFEPTTATYEREFVVQVTDSQGVGIAGANVQVSVRSKFYKKGFYIAGANDRWVPIGGFQDGVALPPLRCPDEDFNFNGQLDAGEDYNESGQIEAGNIVSVSPGELTTGENGTALFRIVYAQEFGNWADVTITARASVEGTEFQDSTDHSLEITTADASTSQSPPGGLVSRFGGDPNHPSYPDNLDRTFDANDPQIGSARLTELGFGSTGRHLGCKTLD